MPGVNMSLSTWQAASMSMIKGTSCSCVALIGDESPHEDIAEMISTHLFAKNGVNIALFTSAQLIVHVLSPASVTLMGGTSKAAATLVISLVNMRRPDNSLLGIEISAAGVTLDLLMTSVVCHVLSEQSHLM